MYDDFVKAHSRLRVSPEMAAGVSTRLWDVAGIVALVEAEEARIDWKCGPFDRHETAWELGMELVTLQEITIDTVRSVTSLEVSPGQRAYVASNAVSISEAHFNPGAWFRAIYAGSTPVGFVMLFDPTAHGAIARGPVADQEVGLWRFMIDHRYQQKGFGKEALDLVCDHVRRAGHANRLLSSYIPGPDGPEGFYLGYGFSKTGRLRNDGHEVEIILPLRNSD